MKKESLKLVVLTPGFAADDADTTTIPSLQLYFRNLKKNHPAFDIHIITFHYPSKKKKYYWNGIPVYAAGGSRWGHAGKLLLWINILKLLFSINRKGKINCVHAFWLTDTALTGCIFRSLTRIPLVITAMGQDVKKSNPYLPFIKLFSPGIIFLSAFQATYNSSLSKKNYRIIPFGTDPAYHELTTDARTTDVLGVGNLNQIKNFSDYIRIISVISKSYPGIHCKIIGKGEELSSLEKLISEMHLEKNIILTGELSYRDTMNEMRSAKVLLHTSTFEGQGMAVTEALASGAHVISYPTGISTGLRSAKIHTGTTSRDLCRLLHSLIETEQLSHFPEIFFTIKYTCDEYIKLYRILV